MSCTDVELAVALSLSTHAIRESVLELENDKRLLVGESVIVRVADLHRAGFADMKLETRALVALGEITVPCYEVLA